MLYSDFEEALLLLPFSAACEILQMLPKLLKNQYQIEMVAKLTLSLIQVHHAPLVASQQLLPQIEDIQKLAMNQILSLRVNIYFLKLINLIDIENDYYVNIGYRWIQSTWNG